jgi:XapX domain-containing protein/PAS domain S-box-containing protein
MNLSEAQLRIMIDTIPAMAWCCLPDGSNEFTNKRMLDYTGLSRAENLGQGWQRTVHPDDLGKLVEWGRAVQASGEPGGWESRLRRFDGEYRWFLIRAEPARDEHGNVVRWFGSDDRRRTSGLRCGGVRATRPASTAGQSRLVAGEKLRRICARGQCAGARVRGEPAGSWPRSRTRGDSAPMGGWPVWAVEPRLRIASRSKEGKIMAAAIIGLVLGLVIGAGCRFFDIPSPAPPRLIGACLLLAMTVGFVTADHILPSGKTLVQLNTP